MIPQSEFALRRQRLIKQLKPNSMVLLPSANHHIRNNDAEYAFRQDSDFYYLTGFNEPNALLALIPNQDAGEYVLFCEPKDPQAELWNGKRMGLEGVKQELNVNQSYDVADMQDVLAQLLENKACIYSPLGKDSQFDLYVVELINRVKEKIRKGVSAPTEIACVTPLIHEHRLIKSENEITVMKKAAQISAMAHKKAMQACTTLTTEYELEAEYQYHFIRSGSRAAAYNSIVGGGGNACILHYTQNDQPLNHGELVLVDAGCEYQVYASDITRTFPINGQFTKNQAALYQIVLDAQLAAIEKVKPGHTFDCPHQAAIRVITQGLLDLGILQGELETLIEDEAYKPFYMHKTSHWLGLDVHDVGAYKNQEQQWRTLEKNMVLTIEPGLYISEEQSEVDPQWRGIGIRIEDDILVTDSGYEVLSCDVPKTIKEIESLMQTQS